MKNLLLNLLFGLLAISTVACGGNQSSEESASDEQQEEMAPATETSAMTTSGEGYAITVLDAEPASPRKEMKGKIGEVDVTINYGSPKAKGRQLFGDGGLETYGEVWRSGANQQTTITFSGDVRIGATEVPAGTYGLFTIPGEEMWTVIINEATDMWGSNDYDEAKDVVRVAVKSQTGEFAEEMDFVIDGDAIVLKWGETAVPFKVVAL